MTDNRSSAGSAVEGELDTIVQLIHKHVGIRQRIDADLTGVEDAARAILSTRHQCSSAGTRHDLSCAADFLDDIEVDENGKCEWTAVANAQTHIRASLRCWTASETQDDEIDRLRRQVKISDNLLDGLTAVVDSLKAELAERTSTEPQAVPVMRGPDCACCEQQPRKDCAIPGCAMKDAEWALPAPQTSAERCPTCNETDASYGYAPPFRRCNDPWHADNHLRRKSSQLSRPHGGGAA